MGRREVDDVALKLLAISLNNVSLSTMDLQVEAMMFSYAVEVSIIDVVRGRGRCEANLG